MATLERSKLRGSVVRRTLEPSSDDAVRLRIDLGHTLPDALRIEIEAEVDVLRAHPIEGLVAPRAVQTHADHVLFELEPIHPGAVRLADLLRGLTAGPLPDGLAAALTATAAQLAHKIHLSTGRRGVPRLHGACHPGALVLTPMGTVALVGTGLPNVDSLLLAEDLAAEVRASAPEVAAGVSADPRSDVYGLGVLYLTLLAGRTPWPDVTAEAHRAALAAGRMSNPGISIPDPRPALVEVLRRAMAPDPDQRYPTALAFGQAISNELKASRRPRGDAGALQSLLRDAVPADAARGPALLTGRRGAPTVTVPKDTPTRPAPPSHDAWVAASAEPEPAPSLGTAGWSGIFGAPTDPGAKPPAASPAPAPSAPAPSAPAPASGLSLPVPSEPGANKSALPLPSGGSSGPTLPAAPIGGVAPAVPPPSLGDAQAIEALYDEDVPSVGGATPARRTPRFTPPDADEGGVKGTLLIGAALLVGVFLLWFAMRGDEAPNDEPPPPAPMVLADSGVIAAPDASAAPAAAFTLTPDAGQPAMKPLGFLTVFSTPTGATVELDGGYVGKTPLVLKHDFEDRVYELTVLRDGHKPWKKTVRPDPEKKSIHVKALLEKR